MVGRVDCVQLPTQPPSSGLSLSQLITSAAKLGRSTTPAPALRRFHGTWIGSADPAGYAVQHPAQTRRTLVTKPVKDGTQIRICAPEFRQVHMGGDQVRKRGRRPTGRPRTRRPSGRHSRCRNPSWGRNADVSMRLGRRPRNGVGGTSRRSDRW